MNEVTQLLKDKAEAIRALAPPNFALTYYHVEANPPNGVVAFYERLSRAFPEIMLKAGEEALPWDNRSYLFDPKDLDVCWVRGWVWNFSDGEWARQVDINMSVTPSIGLTLETTCYFSSYGDDNAKTLGRDLWSVHYAETGYEGHGQVHHEYPEEKIHEFYNFVCELTDKVST